VSDHQTYVGVLTELGMAAAISVLDRGYRLEAGANGHVWGALREDWFASRRDQDLRNRVTGMASAAATALARLPAEDLFEAAQTYGLPIPRRLAKEIAEHFSIRRDEVLTYRR
jgi:hypothetical protein